MTPTPTGLYDINTHTALFRLVSVVIALAEVDIKMAFLTTDTCCWNKFKRFMTCHDSACVQLDEGCLSVNSSS